ncbi:fimbrial protein [Pluralibacter sp.]|jgi:minor pilin subunit PapF|uniref:fimbrial protein n=1 Tax=Pluralibacter sp. TaxID=1920032 RepID=UPI0025E7DC8E|nr:fimbrial protein [Pluralibacter sp.]
MNNAGEPSGMKIYLLLFTVMLVSMRPVNAEDVNITITGEIVIPPCIVNNGGNIDVDFGSVSVTDVTNARNVKTLSVPVTCTYYQGTPYVRVRGTQLSGAASNILATDVSRFGIALYQGTSADPSAAMMLGDGQSGSNGSYLGYPIQSGSLSGVNQANGQFTFTAVPFQLGSTLLAAGAFSASASMSISYQ